MLVGESWETLYTYESVLEELDPTEKPADGAQTLMQMAQKFGG